MNDVDIATDAETTAQPGTGDWESEGGALEPNPALTLPEEVIAVTSVHYRVGPYSYARLEDALAEHRRQSGE